MENLNAWLDKPLFLVFYLAWTLFWKGLALWHSAQKKHVVWFVIILVLNTMGLLDIAYIYYLSRWDLGSSRILNSNNKKVSKKKR